MSCFLLEAEAMLHPSEDERSNRERLLNTQIALKIEEGEISSPPTSTMSKALNRNKNVKHIVLEL
jgi:hypothetical protein